MRSHERVRAEILARRTSLVVVVVVVVVVLLLVPRLRTTRVSRIRKTLVRLTSDEVLAVACC